MKKWIFCGVAIIVLSTVEFFTAASKETPELSPTQLANIEALAEDEGTPVGDCYLSASFNGEPGWYVFCDDRTSNSMIYPCASQRTFGNASVTTKCTK